MSLYELQEEIIANRRHRGWESADDLSKTTLGLVEEVGEFEKARREGDVEEQADALVDVIVFALGGLDILGKDAHLEIERVVLANRDREGQTDH